MELVEEEKTAENRAEGDPALSLVPAHLDEQLDIILDSSVLLRPSNPNSSSQQLDPSILASGPILSTTCLDKPISSDDLEKLSIAGKPYAASEPQSDFEKQISALLEDVHEQEDDSDAADSLLYEPSSKSPPRCKAAQTPTFSESKRTDFHSVEDEKDYITLKTTEEPIYQSKPSAMQSSTYEDSQEFFSFAPKNEEKTGNQPADFSFTEAVASKFQPGKSQNDQLQSLLSPTFLPSFTASPVKLPTENSGLKLTHSPVSTNPLEGQMMPVARVSPPPTFSQHRTVRRHRFIKKRENCLTGEVRESIEEEVKTGYTQIRPNRKVKKREKRELSEQREAVNWGSQIDEEMSAVTAIQEEIPSCAQDITPKPIFLHETPIEEAQTLAQPFSPISSATPDQFVLPASPQVKPRPKPVSSEFRPNAICGESESQTLSANPLLKTHSDNEGDDDFSINTPGNAHIKDLSLKPVQDQSQISAFESAEIKEESAGPEEETRKFMTEDKTAERQTGKKAPAEERKKVVKWMEEEDKKQTWLEADTSIDPMLEDDSRPPATAPGCFPEPSIVNVQPAAILERRSNPISPPPITHNEIWPQFEQIDIQAYLEPEITSSPQKTSCFSRCFRAAPIVLDRRLKDQISRIYALTHMKLENTALHIQVLMSVWRFLTRSRRDCARCGRHWGKLGFRGTDPGTELMNVGIFGLLQLLFFACNMPDDADAILTYSHQSGISFPFAILSLRISEMAIETMRAGQLDKVIEKRGEAYRTVRIK